MYNIVHVSGAVEGSALDEVNEVKQYVGNEMANR